MTGPFDKDPREKLEHALADPVSALRASRQRFRSADSSYTNILYEELSVAFAANRALLENPVKWAAYAEYLRDNEGEQPPEEPTFPDSLHTVVSFVFAGKQSPNRMYKYARALEELHQRGVEPNEVVRLLRDRGVDHFYDEASRNHPRRSPAAVVDNAEEPENVAGTAAAPPKRTPKPQPEQTSAVSISSDDDGHNDWPEDSEGGSEASKIAVDPTATLWLRIDPYKLKAALAMEKGDRGRIEIECAGFDLAGWKLFDAVRFQRPKRP